MQILQKWPCESVSVSVSVLSHSGLHHQHRSPCTLTTLINIWLSALFEVCQPALPFSCLLLGKHPERFLRSCRKLPMSPFPNTPEDTLLQINCTEVHPRARNPCLIPAAFICKAGIKLPLCCLCCWSSHTYFHYEESMDCKLPQQIVTGDSKNSENQISINKRQENAL